VRLNTFAPRRYQVKAQVSIGNISHSKTVTLRVEKAPLLTLSGPREIFKGKLARYSLVIANMGWMAIKGVVKRVIPAGMGYKRNSSGVVLQKNITLGARKKRTTKFTLLGVRVGTFRISAQLIYDGKVLVEQSLMTKVKERSRQEEYINHLIKTAKTKMNNHEYNAAKLFLDQAIGLDPANKEAQVLQIKLALKREKQ